LYNVNSNVPAEFISHSEILETLKYAEQNKGNIFVIDSIIAKARLKKGISHREAAVLLECEISEKNAEIFALASKIKREIYGDRIVIFAPLYLSNYCVNSCLYCPYHVQNKIMPRIRLSQEQIRSEVAALQEMGHKRLALEMGEDPVNNPIDYLLESIETVYGVKHKNGDIRRVNVNIAATEEDDYRKLRNAGIGTYILFQETYHSESYKSLHPKGPKSNYDYHTSAMDRAMRAGIDDVGLGVLFGLELYRYEFAGLLMHAEHLEAAFGVGPHTISVPRIKDAGGINARDFGGISDEVFAKLVACIRIAVPYTGMIVSTRESVACRERVLELGISQISGGSNTNVGGYASNESDTSQFYIDDTRTLDEIVDWLIGLKYVPSFCTACYREGRTGERFMKLSKSGRISDRCSLNALITLKEYAEDYASRSTKRHAEELIQRELSDKAVLVDYLKRVENGDRDIRF
jgi:2-iminoacetate synthase